MVTLLEINLVFVITGILFDVNHLGSPGFSGDMVIDVEAYAPCRTPVAVDDIHHRCKHGIDVG